MLLRPSMTVPVGCTAPYVVVPAWTILTMLPLNTALTPSSSSATSQILGVGATAVPPGTRMAACAA